MPDGYFVRSLVQLEIGSLTIFWDARNIMGTDRAYVPGFVIPSQGSAFGVRWEFLN